DRDPGLARRGTEVQPAAARLADVDAAVDGRIRADQDVAVDRFDRAADPGRLQPDVAVHVAGIAADHGAAFERNAAVDRVRAAREPRIRGEPDTAVHGFRLVRARPLA